MDGFLPIIYDRNMNECLPEFCISGRCRELTELDPDYYFRIFKNNVIGECTEGYYGFNHCSWSKINFLFVN